MLLKIIKLGLVVPKFIGFFLWFLVANVARVVAPNLIINMVKNKKMGSMKVDSVDDIGFMYSWDMVYMQTRKNVRDILKDAQLGEKAPNPEIYDLKSGSYKKLLEFAKKGRPFVLNFGSCT